MYWYLLWGYIRMEVASSGNVESLYLGQASPEIVDRIKEVPAVDWLRIRAPLISIL